MSHYSQQKKERLNTLKEYIDDKGPLALDKIRAEMEIDFGLSETKVDEYLDTLEAADKVEIDRDSQTVKRAE